MSCATPAYDVVINADHLLTWAIDARTLRDAAMDNLRAWSATAPWSDELAGDRHLLSSDTGDGGDAARILLPEVREAPRRRVRRPGAGPRRRCPDRDLLIAGSLQPGDERLRGPVRVVRRASVVEGAHEPIERGLFELVGDECELVRYAG